MGSFRNVMAPLVINSLFWPPKHGCKPLKEINCQRWLNHAVSRCSCSERIRVNKGIRKRFSTTFWQTFFTDASQHERTSGLTKIISMPLLFGERFQIQGSILAVVRSSETTIKSCGRVSKITKIVRRTSKFFFSSISHQSMYSCFECPPAIQRFCTVVNCKLCFVARTTRNAVFSEVRCLQAQFFVLERWCIAAICKQKDSRSLAAREFCKMWRYFDKVSPPLWKKKKVNLPSKVLSTKKSNKSVHFSIVA